MEDGGRGRKKGRPGRGKRHEVWDRWDNLDGGVHVKKGPVIWGTREHPNRSRGPFELSQEELVRELQS